MESNTNLGGKWYDKEIGKGIFSKKYMHEDDKGVADVFKRVAKTSQVEAMEEHMERGDILPAGRSIYGAESKGKFKVTLSNCYILRSPTDTIEDIYDTNKEMARVFSYGGGCGISISNLRPKGAKVNNSAKTSSGAVSFLELFNSTGDVIGQNGRRAAIMVMLDCSHPDLYEFLKIKQTNHKLESMNISIKFTDEFMVAVRDNTEYTLRFDVESTGEHIERTIDARKFFEEFCETNWDFGDPGACYITPVRDYNLLSRYPEYQIDCSNPCVTGDTIVMTRNGYEPIVKLIDKPCDIWNGYEWSTVIPKVTGRNQKMLKVSLSNGMSLDCTRYHKFILKDDSRVKAEELTVGDKLSKWDYPVITGDNSSLYEGKVNPYMNGFYSGDGTKNRSEIVVYADKRKLIDKLEPLRVLPYDGFSKVILSEVPIGKSFVPTVSESISFRLKWLAGLIDSDGCKNDETGSIAISSIDREFIGNVQLMLSTMGCHSSIAKMRAAGKKLLPKNDGSGEYGEYYCQDCYRIVISCFYVKKLLDIGLELFRVEVNPHPNRDAGRFVYVTKIEKIEDESIVYCFDEPINHSGIFNGIMTAQCSEFFGNAGNSCNLTSINLYNIVSHPFTKEAKVDYGKLKQLVTTSVVALNNILDYGYELQPLEINRECIKDWRSIGLGVMGISDMYVALGLRYGSEEANGLTEDVFHVILKESIRASAMLASKHGTFGKYNWKKTKESPMMKLLEGTEEYRLVQKYGLRNGTLLSIAPTGSIATAIGVSTGIEPFFRVSYERTTHSMEGEGKTFVVHSKSVEDLLRFHGLPQDMPVESIKERFPFVVDTDDIAPSDRVRTQSVIQQYVDNAISSTVNLKESATPQDIFEIYMAAWKGKLKGITVFRDGCARGNILGVKKDKPKLRRRDIHKINGSTFKKSSSCAQSMYVTVNSIDQGTPFEIFTNSSGGCASNIGTITRLTSLALRHGVSAESVIRELKENKCPACQLLRRQGNADVSLSCGSAIAEALEESCGSTQGVTKGITKELQETKLECPECHEKTLVSTGKCFSCSNCGYSKCD